MLLPLVALWMFPLFGAPSVLETVEETPAASRYDTALTAYREGRYTEAIAALITGSALKAGEANLLGWAYLQAGSKEEAVAAFIRSLELDPGMHDSYCGLGFTYFRSGAYGQAVQSFEQAAAGSPGTECLQGYAKALAASGQIDLAEQVNASAIPPPAMPELTAAGPERTTEFVARGQYFWRRSGEDPFEIVYVKGVNLSFAKPGKHVTEFPRDTDAYLEWFRLVREMNANVIRIYTILPPEFYGALRDFNRGRDAAERLFLVQGIWAELPRESRFRDVGYIEQIRQEVRSAVDVVHGRATIAHRYGHAHGVYRADVANDVLAFVFGREWEPSAVSRFQEMDSRDAFRGDYLGIESANPMETWLTEMLDHLVGYEQRTYAAQRPVAWMSWPTLDPLHHPSEATFEESLVFRHAAGERSIGRPPADEIYDDDAMTLDETKVVPTRAYRAGVFASHHVYPYYPDFMRNEPRYGAAGHGRYRGYLDHLKTHYRDIPLLISEYGVPTSRAIGRFHPEGLDHGGHSEQQQADALKRMTEDIRAAGCAGGIVFSWIDEWVKRNWMVAGTEGQDRRWYNAMDPEESYGLLAMAPTERRKVRGDPAAWDASTLIQSSGRAQALRPLNDGSDASRRLERLFADSDAGYLYLRLDVGGRIDWSDSAYVLAIDTFGDAEGDHTLPLELGIRSEIGIEFAVVLHGERSRVLIDDRYNRTRFAAVLERQPGRSGWEFHDDYRLESNDDGRFVELVIPHGRKFGRDGTIYPERTYHAGRLEHGNLDEDSSADWLYTPAKNMLELRIPWGLLHFSDPSRREVLGGPTARLVTPGIRIAAFSYRPRSRDDSRAVTSEAGPNYVDALPSAPGKMASYSWPTWENPAYVSHLKAAYFTMQEEFGKLHTPDPSWAILPQFDFAGVIENHYASLNEFFDLPAVREVAVADGGDLYGAAMANLTVGLVRGERFHLLQAAYLLKTLEAETDDPRMSTASAIGLDYLRGLLSGTIAPGKVQDGEVRRIEIEPGRTPPKHFETITLGRSAIRLRDGARVRTQVDRVTRDWLSGINFTHRPGAFAADRVVPWHEGARTMDLVAYAAVDVQPVWGTMARKFGERWFAPDADGTFRFEVTADKVYGYPTNLFLDDRNVWINDTHGISALAWDATAADLVIGCGDHVGKADAAYDLARRGVNVYMPTDRFLYTLMGTQTAGMVLGSAPIRDTDEGAVLGDQPVTFRVDEPIVVSNTTQRYPLQYYDTPFRYFGALASYANVEFNLTAVDVPGYGKAGVVVERARELGAKLIGIRVATLEEHDVVAAWLAGDRDRRAILFHSAVYPDGYRLFAEFPDQTSFGDIHPEFGR